MVVLLGVIVAFGGSLIFSSTRTPTDATAAEAPLQQIDGIWLRVSGDPADRVALFAQPNVPQPTTQVAPLIPRQPDAETANPTATATPLPQPTATPPPVVQAVATNTPAPLARVDSVDPIIFQNYIVQPNDTLYSIATARMDSSIALISRFGISSDDIVAGAVIPLPIGNPAYCSGRRPYAVGEGDTAYSIARRYGTTHENLAAINGLNANYTIRIGEIICVP